MSEYEVILTTEKKEKVRIEITDKTTFEELKPQYGSDGKDPIVLAMFRGKLCELNKEIDASGEVSFLTMTNRDGRRTYRRSVTILMQKAVQNLWGLQVHVKVLYSLGQSFYCELEGIETSRQNILALKIEMLRLADEDIRIEKLSVHTENAEKMFGALGMRDKERLLHYRRSSRVNLYSLDGMRDYYYGYMVPSTGYLKYFDLQLYEDGFVLLFPGENATVVEPLKTSTKLYHTLKDSRSWSRMLNIGTIGAFNDAIAAGMGEEMILLQEALMEEQIGNLAEQIASDRTRKFVMIAGPSSSGKTTFSRRLSIQLSAKGLQPHAVGLDDYYADRVNCPKNPDGTYDFECLEALDVELFNRDMTRLLAGEKVEMPSFNFKTGMREYRGKQLQLGSEDVLVIEGIHGLNDKLSYTLPGDSKFKIYISALAQLNVDEHNPLSTTDCRLLRRIVRDARTRGTNAKETIAMWDSVRRGEEKYIFPFQDSADAFFNSALVYELPVLKVYAEPLLFEIPRDCPEYTEAKRLLKFLDYFLPMPTEGIAQNSLVREFVGGSCFHV